MLNVDSKDTVSCIWFTSFRNWKHNYKYFIKRNCKIRNTICRKAKWYTQDTEKINLQNGSMSLVGCGDETITVRVLCKVL